MGKLDRIFLIGPMGAGKSTIGRHLADLLHKDFCDTDHEIEKRTGASVSLIFEIEGEEGFRRRESAVIEELSERSNLILATGGGAVLAEGNRKLLHQRGVVVYLQAPIETLLARTQRDRHRPLLQQGDRRAKFEEILRTRDPLYRETAHVIVVTDHRAPTAVAQEIVAKIEALTGNENAAS